MSSEDWTWVCSENYNPGPEIKKKSLLYYLNHLFLPDPFLLTMLIALKKTQFLLILTNIVKQNPTLTESDLELIRY